MTAALIAILSLIALGLPVTLAIDPRARGPLLLGLAFLYGTGLMFFVMLALSAMHVRWTLPSVAVSALIVMVGCWSFVVRRAPAQRPTTNDERRTTHVLDLLTLLTITGYAFYATIAPMWEWDFWAIWGLKARVFLEHGGIDWRFLESGWNLFAHPDYPLLVPLNFDFVALLGGGWSDRWLGLLFVAWAAAVTLIVRGLAAAETPPLVASLIALACVSVAASHYVGLAEGAVIAFCGAGVLFVRRALLTDDPAAWRHGALLLGLGANAKNEGLAFVAAAAIALLIVRRRALLRLWPAAALAVPWLLLRAAHTLPTDIVGGSVFARVAARAPYALQMFVFLGGQLVEVWFWVAVLAGILIAPAARRNREAFVLLVTFIQLVFYVGTYMATPHDARWHIATSWPRLTVQLSLPITFAVMMMLAVAFPGVESAVDVVILSREDGSQAAQPEILRSAQDDGA
jgi:hypothetical protein